MTATLPTQTGAIATELDAIHRDRDAALRSTAGPERALRLAELFEREAWLWSLLFERTRSRLTWRAALAAEAHARQCARYWRRVARTLGGAA